MATEYMTDEERKAKREKDKAERMAADDRIALMKKKHEEDAVKLRAARQEAAKAKESAKTATLAANEKSATFPTRFAPVVVAPGTPIVGSIAALIDGRVGSKEDVASWVTAGVGLVTGIGSFFMDSPNGMLVGAVILGGGLSSTLTRRSREAGARMREHAGAPPPARG
jgi:hypothetical protein